MDISLSSILPEGIKTDLSLRIRLKYIPQKTDAATTYWLKPLGSLLEKNRKEIYEHDLLQDEEGVIYEIWYSEEKACFMAEMVNPQNDMVDILGGYGTERCFEIVGNKFDNPNL